MKKFMFIILFPFIFSLTACGSAVGENGGNPSYIRTYDVIDNHHLRHTCIENTRQGTLSCN